MPRRLGSYVLRETMGLYLLGVAAFCLLLSIDFLSVLASFLINNGASIGSIGLLMLYRLPWFLHISLPIAVVFAVLLATGRLARDSELKAAYALGTAPLTLLAPLVTFGLTVSALSIANNGYLEPLGDRAYQELIETFIYARPPAESQNDASYAIDGAGIYFAGRVRANLDDLDRAELSGVLVLSDDGTSYSAQSGVWDSQARSWELRQVEIIPPGGTPRTEPLITLPFELPTNPAETLARGETLTLSELAARLGRAGQSGIEIRELRFLFHRRLADAMGATIFALIAATLGLNLRGRAAGFAWTIVLLVVFWALWELSQDFFGSGVLSAVAAAWFTPVLVGAVGVGLAVWRLRP